MKLFAIRDESEKNNPILGYLVYYEKDKNFYIELPTNADPWRTPLLLSSFVKRGEQTVNAYWSKLWVQQRIVPSDRQNIGKILKENGLNEYDEYELLMLGEGRCAQDDYYLEALPESELPQEVAERFRNKVEDVVPLKNRQLLVFFRDGVVRKCDMRIFFEKEVKFLPLLNSQEYFCKVAVESGGYGICWGKAITISDKELYEYGTDVGLSLDDFRDFVSHRVVNAAEAAEILECSRQNIGDLVQREKLHPIKREAKNTLFLKSEVIQRKWM